MNWIAPHPDMAFAPAPSGKGIAKIFRENGGYSLYLQTNTEMLLNSHHETLKEAKNKAASL